MYWLYKILSAGAGPFMHFLLKHRARHGKEDTARIGERMGISGLDRPGGPLIWLHAASVGEAQSALTLVSALCALNRNIHIVVTTGTPTSAALLKQRLPDRAFHQYYPLDHPKWARHFLDHWKPDLALWMESELWPNMLHHIRSRAIPACLINGRMSAGSVRRWQMIKGNAQSLLAGFSAIFVQSETDRQNFISLGADNVVTTGNLKYSAAPLPYDAQRFEDLQNAIGNRPLWLYASTHEGEEALAVQAHKELRGKIDDVLTVIVPRHPQRGAEIFNTIKDNTLNIVRRSDNHALPGQDTDIYIADTLGELGLFYRLAPVAVIGRSFSNDGGGGHNPYEAAQLRCAVLHGPHVQNLPDIYADMHAEDAAIEVAKPEHLAPALQDLLAHGDKLQAFRARAYNYTQKRGNILDKVLEGLAPVLERAGIEITGNRIEEQAGT